MTNPDAPRTAWVLSDGKAGDEAQCLAVAEALGCDIECRRVAPRAPYVWAMPWGPIDPAEAATRPASPVRPPFPDVVIASGRRTVAYLRHIRRRAGRRTLTVFLKDPRTGVSAADLIWVPEHDALRGANVITSLTPPHRFSPALLRRLRSELPAEIMRLPRPRVAVLVGGDSRHHRFDAYDVETFGHRLEHLAEGARLMVTLSRRTPALLADRLARLVRSGRHLMWDGSGANPMADYLAAADAVVVTADSTNMVGEAAATGRPVLVYEPSGGDPRISTFLEKMTVMGVVRPFDGRLETFRYEPLDSTPMIVEAVRAAWRARHGPQSDP